MAGKNSHRLTFMSSAASILKVASVGFLLGLGGYIALSIFGALIPPTYFLEPGERISILSWAPERWKQCGFLWMIVFATTFGGVGIQVTTSRWLIAGPTFMAFIAGLHFRIVRLPKGSTWEWRQIFGLLASACVASGLYLYLAWRLRASVDCGDSAANYRFGSTGARVIAIVGVLIIGLWLLWESWYQACLYQQTGPAFTLWPWRD